MNEDELSYKVKIRLENFIAAISIKGDDFNGPSNKQTQKFRCNYWGFIFSRVKRVEDKTLESLMAVAPQKDGSIHLLYNAKLVNGLNDYDLLCVLEHEGLHILNKHIARSMRIFDSEFNEEMKWKKFKLFCLACDFAVNSQANLPLSLKTNGEEYKLCHPQNYGFPEKESSEYYYLKLLKKQEEDEKNNKSNKDDSNDNSKKSSGGNSKKPNNDLSIPENNIDSHVEWESGKENLDESKVLPKRLDDFVRNLVRDSTKIFEKQIKERGNIPGYLQEVIREALEPPKVPYYQVIRNLIKGSRISKFKPSSTKINRKRSYVFFLNENKSVPIISPFPGKKRDFTFKIAILLDTSGSMSITEIKEGLSGIKNIIENDRNCSVTVIENDTEVVKEYTVKRIDDIDFSIKGRGGTQMGPGLIRCKEIGVDVCLCFTDGYTENINEIDRKFLPKKIIWAVPEKGTINNINKTGYIVRT